MRDFCLCRERFLMRVLFSVPTLLSSFSAATLGGNGIISGRVFNQSRGQASVGDEVIVIRLDMGMQEEARAKTNEQGAFAFSVQYPGKPYLVRVMHQSLSYDEQVSGGQPLSIQVFDAAPHVLGITGSIEILRASTNGNLLHVSDLIEIKNESNPPLTQAGERTFEVYLPVNAKIDSVLAAGPEKIGVAISAVPVPGEPGHYALSFPVRPGATKFAFNYDLPYDGHALFQTRHGYPLQQFAVMISPTMKFFSHSAVFKILAIGNGRYQVQVANQLKAGKGPEFEVFGDGALPLLGDQAKARGQLQSPISRPPVVSAPTRAAFPSPGSSYSHLKQTQAPSQSLVLGGVTSILLAACALMVWRAHKARVFSAEKRVAPGGPSRPPSPPGWQP